MAIGIFEGYKIKVNYLGKKLPILDIKLFFRERFKIIMRSQLVVQGGQDFFFGLTLIA